MVNNCRDERNVVGTDGNLWSQKLKKKSSFDIHEVFDSSFENFRSKLVQTFSTS